MTPLGPIRHIKAVRSSIRGIIEVSHQHGVVTGLIAGAVMTLALIIGIAIGIGALRPRGRSND